MAKNCGAGGRYFGLRHAAGWNPEAWVTLRDRFSSGNSPTSWPSPGCTGKTTRARATSSCPRAESEGSFSDLAEFRRFARPHPTWLGGAFVGESDCYEHVLPAIGTWVNCKDLPEELMIL